MKQNRILSSLVIFSGVFVILSTLLISSASAGNSVKVENRQLLTDFDGDGKYEPFFVKGVGYAPVPIGKFFARDTTWSGVCSYTGYYPLHFPALRFERDSPDANNAFSCTNGSQFYTDSQILDRDFSLIAAMKANTIRTWDKVTPQILQKANAHGLKVIAGYWMNHDIDYTFPDDPTTPFPLEQPGDSPTSRTMSTMSTRSNVIPITPRSCSGAHQRKQHGFLQSLFCARRREL